MSKRLWIAAACLYAAMALFTYGHSASRSSAWFDAHCSTAASAKATGDYCMAWPTGGAIFSALFWPLYWSWELQS